MFLPLYPAQGREMKNKRIEWKKERREGRYNTKTYVSLFKRK